MDFTTIASLNHIEDILVTLYQVVEKDNTRKVQADLLKDMIADIQNWSQVDSEIDIQRLNNMFLRIIPKIYSDLSLEPSVLLFSAYWHIYTNVKNYMDELSIKRLQSFTKNEVKEEVYKYCSLSDNGEIINNKINDSGFELSLILDALKTYSKLDLVCTSQKDLESGRSVSRGVHCPECGSFAHEKKSLYYRRVVDAWHVVCEECHNKHKTGYVNELYYVISCDEKDVINHGYCKLCDEKYDDKTKWYICTFNNERTIMCEHCYKQNDEHIKRDRYNSIISFTKESLYVYQIKNDGYGTTI